MDRLEDLGGTAQDLKEFSPKCIAAMYDVKAIYMAGIAEADMRAHFAEKLGPVFRNENVPMDKLLEMGEERPVAAYVPLPAAARHEHNLSL